MVKVLAVSASCLMGVALAWVIVKIEEWWNE